MVRSGPIDASKVSKVTPHTFALTHTQMQTQSSTSAGCKSWTAWLICLNGFPDTLKVSTQRWPGSPAVCLACN